MSRFLERLREVSAEYPEKEAFFNSRIKEDACQRLTYAELDAWSDSLAASFAEWSPKGKPVVVYGHKSPLMLVCFIAAAKAGLTYAPVDIAYPSDRVNDILDQIGHPLVITLSTTNFPAMHRWQIQSSGGCRCSRGGPGGTLLGQFPLDCR